MDWRTLATTAALVFVAELSGKTQLTVLNQTCKFRVSAVAFVVIGPLMLAGII